MAQEPQAPQVSEQPRHCPACGSRVAAMATTCLMCGVSLAEVDMSEPEQEAKVERRLPGWARALIVVLLAILILSAGIFGFFKLMTVEPDEPAESVTPTTTAIPTHTPTATPTPTPTLTPAPLPTPTSIPPLVHQVREGETLIDIAILYDVPIEHIQILNPDLDPDLLQVGQVILIPVATPTPGPTSTLDPNIPTPTPPEYIVHIVSPGETLSTIAERYAEQYPGMGVSVQSIRDASNLPSDDDTIRVNQSLIIPLGTPSPDPTPTRNPNATPTLAAPHPAPPLLSPPNGTIIVGNTEPILLQWASMSLLRDDEWYELTLSQPAGGVISATAYTRATAWRIPVDLMPASDADIDIFQWQVQVVQETRNQNDELFYREAGDPSELRTFAWLMVTPTPSATPTPTSTFTPTPTSTPTPTFTPTSTPTSTITSTVTPTFTPTLTPSPTTP